jgi:hypothetical protein
MNFWMIGGPPTRCAATAGGGGRQKKILDDECWVLNCKFVLHLYPYCESDVAGTATGGNGGIRKFWMMDFEWWIQKAF